MNLLLLATLLSVFVLGTLSLQTELLPYNPVADPNVVVISGNARFTVLTPRLIRIEYSSKGRFEDRATMAFVNRRLPRPVFTHGVFNGVLQINTTYLQLAYRVGQPFSASSLSISFKQPSTFKQWNFGQPNPSNLLGTIKSLDELTVISLNCTVNKDIIVHNEKLHCEWGLISREGWAVVDDSQNWVLDENFWWVEPSPMEVDQYFFGHGHNYKEALYDYTQVGGKIAMVPRNAMGIWWSRWYNLNNFDVKQVVDTYQNRGLPLDVYILDMDWHTKNAWGGYSVDKRLFPVPAATFSWLMDKGLIVGANLHDDDGVHNYEDMYPQMARAMGIDPASKKDIPFHVVNSTYMYALDDIVLGDVEHQGMTFWWIDWQQGGTQGGAAGGKQNPTIGLNKVRSTDHIRRGEAERGLVLARWGGLGSHRYQVGFSGDVLSVNWKDLAFQPYYSFTSSNVAYGFWSHDLVGPAVDHELHTRWIQWGAYSGIFRTHDRGMSVGMCADSPQGCPIVEVWKNPSPYFEAMRDAMIAREELIPYIYTALRQAYDTGISLLRPMYYEFPEHNIAYLGDETGKFGQYFFGNDMFVAPVTSPALANTSMASISIWIPPGNWVEKETGFLHSSTSSGTVLTKSIHISEVPVFVRAGAIIPGVPVRFGDTVGIAVRQYATLVLTIYPGAASSNTTIYEDDSFSTDYVRGLSAWTTVSYQRTNTDLTLTVDVPTGQGYSTFPKMRTYIIRVVNSLPVISATVNGAAVTYSRYGGPNTWQYDGPRVTTIVETTTVSTGSKLVVTIKTSPINDNTMSGIKGRLLHSILAKQELDESNDTPGTNSVTGGKLDQAASTGELLSYYAGKDQTSFASLLAGFPALFQQAVDEVNGIRPLPPSALIQLWDADRNDNCLCGTQDCLNANNYYERVRVEGYQPPANTPGTIPLRDFWDQAITDNYATTSSGVPPGYSNADFSDGVVFASQRPGRAPISVYWSEERKDMLTVATTEGNNYAKQNGYKLVNATVGYVLTSPPEEDVATQRVGLTPTRWAYAAELLASANN